MLGLTALHYQGSSRLQLHEANRSANKKQASTPSGSADYLYVWMVRDTASVEFIIQEHDLLPVLKPDSLACANHYMQAIKPPTGTVIL